MNLPRLKKQEISYHHQDSVYMFQPNPEKPFLSTPGAIELFQADTIMSCLIILQLKARKYQGLDYLQVFEDQERSEDLWFIEDGDGGAIAALLPSDY